MGNFVYSNCNIWCSHRSHSAGFQTGRCPSYLTKTPSPKVIMQAFQEIRPALILSVPLVIEKIYKTQILPVFRKPLLHILIRIPLLNIILYKKIRQKMVEVFGGNFRELVIGGAPFNIQAERFFKKMKFPFTIGYGMKGWLHSGDLGVIDHAGNIYIRGRSKSMILGPSGKNIYPEEIESILNNRFLVMESLVIEREHKLIALIFPDYDAVEKAGVTKEQLPEMFKAYIHDLNHHMPKYIRISDFEIVSAEFEKPPKRSIKRFLYN